MPQVCKSPDPLAEGRVGTFSEVFPPKPHWTSADVPDLTGQTIIVTGGNSGIGKETCRVLLSKNARVYMAARSEAKAKAAITELKASTGKDKIFWLKLDLADLPSVRHAAEEFMEKEPELHVVFNNGGIMQAPLEDLTAQGYDASFGVNCLGPFFFTTLLLPVLTRTAASESAAASGHRVRVVHTSSNSHDGMAPSAGLVWESMQRDKDKALPMRKKMGKFQLYGQSKLGQVLFAKELARRYGSKGIVSISLHPGLVSTELQRNFNPLVAGAMRAVFTDTAHGAITQLFAGTAPQALELNGEYLTAYARRSKASKMADDPELAKKLWAFCEEQLESF
ncbi:NAD-P-binding protein [Stereum hirsutum FP-91666 SS1]|uniref:NAD-P-binding protein n=1 Tax=Stereum hirsutum (strain FP-91666) TaxID=721885 RepID=UPI000444955C|nr:NAD-P-binding protein [Stereum hirsutum FP-91666 SS1]EIM84129.1 NAD-P-binding protein [Stereum hirsutum FP-91666 SS1]